MNGIKLMVFILGRGRGESLLKLCADRGLGFHVMLRGRGTAGSDVLNLLGIGDPEKDVVLISSTESRTEELLDELSLAMGLDKPGGGIAFSIPFSAVASQLSSYSIMAGTPDEPEGTASILDGVIRSKRSARDRKGK